MSRFGKSDEELEMLRTALSLDRTLFTVQHHTSRPRGFIQVDCFASKGADSLGLTRITRLVAGTLKHNRNVRGLIMNSREDVNHHLVVALSDKLGFELKHENLNTSKRCGPMSFFLLEGV